MEDDCDIIINSTHKKVRKKKKRFKNQINMSQSNEEIFESRFYNRNTNNESIDSIDNMSNTHNKAFLKSLGLDAFVTVESTENDVTYPDVSHDFKNFNSLPKIFQPNQTKYDSSLIGSKSCITMDNENLFNSKISNGYFSPVNSKRNIYDHVRTDNISKVSSEMNIKPIFNNVIESNPDIIPYNESENIHSNTDSHCDLFSNFSSSATHKAKIDMESEVNSLDTTDATDIRSLKSVGNTTSGLSNSLENDLLKHFPDRRAKVMVISWNMSWTSNYPNHLKELFQDVNNEVTSDLFLLCFQEVTNNKVELLTRIQKTVGINYVICDYVDHGRLLSVLICHKKFIFHIGVIGKDTLSTRITIVTKGVAAISFNFFGSSFLFLGSHFSSDMEHSDLRKEDYKSILYSSNLIENLKASSKPKGWDETNLSHYFDYTIWAGDLNFRIHHFERANINKILSQDKQNINVESLLENEELLNEQTKGTMFEEFEEGRISFLPTYKYIVGSDTYNPLRIPAYTDRILFRSQEMRGIDYLFYTPVTSYTNSDHKPIRALMEISIVPHKEEYLRGSGKFNTELYDKCFNEDKTISQTSSTADSKICSVQ